MSAVLLMCIRENYADTGLRPWKVVIGCFFLTVPTYGLLSAIRLFQTYWHGGMLADHLESDVAWIISMFGFLDCLFAAPAGILFDRHGARWLLPLGCVVYIAAFIGLAFSRTYAQIMGCVVVAGSSAVAFIVVSQWFTVRKGLATGCVSLGAPLGGIFFPLVLKALFDNYPWRTAALALTAILTGSLVLGNLLVETNVQAVAPCQQRTSEEAASADPPSPTMHTTPAPARLPPAQISHMLRSPKFWLVSYAIFRITAYELVLFIQWGSIPSYAVAANFEDHQFYLMMSYNIGAVIGRTVPLWLSDRLLGPINTTIVMNLFTLLGLAIAALFIVVQLMGIGTGSFVPLGVSCINALCCPEHMGTWLGSAYSLVSISTLIGNPASAAILARYATKALLAFLAAVLFSGMISAAMVRWLFHGRRWVLKARV
ncbi:MFS general substrate transporter [Parathielavia hyrcaniae]|uniref:MFS general substrate transporter n=1 Tax=Parathielavia hyrcaniae TaxID=113614 RepID=A0AAN6Q442_9PEZI|nr:MFS general substrate transporter [Parathielavia hyrcaniae]